MNEDVDDDYIQFENYKGKIDHSTAGGTQGSVFVFDIPSQTKNSTAHVAVKFHDQKIAYDREVGVFLRLRDLEIIEIGGCMVPQLIDHNDELLAIEMTIVSPAFCLDFGGAYLDRPPDYSPEVWADWREMKSDAFEDDWPAVENILSRSFNHLAYLSFSFPGSA